MKINKINLVCYSPTNTWNGQVKVETIARAIVSTTNEIIHNSITLPDSHTI